MYEPFHRIEGNNLYFMSDKVRERGLGFLCDKDGRLLDYDGMSYVSLGFHTHTFLNPKRWRTHALWNTGPARTLLPVSEAAFQAMTLDFNRYILDFLSGMKDCGHWIRVIEAPPPSPRFFLLRFGYSMEDVLVMDALFRTTFAEELDKRGISYLSTPPDLIESGFLKDSLLASDVNDAHHANSKYGVLMLQHLCRHHMGLFPVEQTG